MEWLDTISIGKKLIGSFLIIAILPGFGARIGYLTMNQMMGEIDPVFHDRAVPTCDLKDADADLY